MTSTISDAVKFNDMLARWAMPDEIVSDNGPLFASDQFHKFSHDNECDFKHTTTSPCPVDFAQLRRY